MSTILGAKLANNRGEKSLNFCHFLAKYAKILLTMKALLAILLTSKVLFFVAFCLAIALAVSLSVLLFLVVLERKTIERELN